MIKPNRHFDALVAERCAGWKAITEDEEQPDAVPYLVAPHYVSVGSEIRNIYYPSVAAAGSDRYPCWQLPAFGYDMKDAWSLVERLNLFSRGTVLYKHHDTGLWIMGDLNKHGHVEAETVPMAVSLWALMRCGVTAQEIEATVRDGWKPKEG